MIIPVRRKRGKAIKFTNLSGKKFGRLFVMSRVDAPSHVKRKSIWFICKCECGKEISVPSSKLKNGHTKSCGCLVKTHGKSHNSSEYRTWNHMKQRCENPNNDAYADYGGRGIKIYPPWSNSFEEWFSYVGEKPSPQHSLDRIDTNGNYEPGNVKWSNQKEQMNNTRMNRFIEFNNQRKTLTQWAETLGISWSTLNNRLKKWPLSRALTEIRNIDYVRNKL